MFLPAAPTQIVCLMIRSFILMLGFFTRIPVPQIEYTEERYVRGIPLLPFVGAVSMSRMSFQAMGKPQFAFGITLVRQLILYVPLLLLLNRIWGFHGMIWAQPVTEVIMMVVSVSLLYGTIFRLQARDGKVNRQD